MVFLTLLVANACAVPTLNVVQNSSTAILNEPYSVIFDLSWQGESDDFVAIPPSLQLDSWAEVSNISTSSFVDGDRSVIRHTITLVPHELGEFTTPDIELAYLAKADIPKSTKENKDEAIADPPYETILAGPLTIRVNEPSDMMLRFMGLVTLGLAMFGCAFVFYRRNAIQIAGTSDHVELTIPSFVHEARKHRLDDDQYAFFQSLARGAELLGNSDDKRSLKKRFSDQAMAVGYKGANVTEEEMDAALRDLERAAANDTPIEQN